MLAVHEERIEQCGKDDVELCKKVEDIESKIDGLYKFRWQAGGVVAVLLALIGVINAFGPKFLTEKTQPSMMERSK